MRLPPLFPLTSISPETIFIPDSLVIVLSLIVSVFSSILASIRLSLSSLFTPVNKAGKSRGLKSKILPFISLGASISKLNIWPVWEILTVFCPSTDIKFILPSDAAISPVLITFSPNKIILFPSPTVKFPLLIIEPFSV